MEGGWGKATTKCKLFYKENALPLTSSVNLDLSLPLWGLSSLCVSGNNNQNSTCLPGWWRGSDESVPPLLLLSGLQRRAQLSTGGQALKQRDKGSSDPTSVAVDAAARARRQRGIGLRLAVEVEPHRKHDAWAAVAEDDLGRLARVHRAQHRPRPPSLHLLCGVRLLIGLFRAGLLRARLLPAVLSRTLLLCSRVGLPQVPRLPGHHLHLPQPRQPRPARLGIR